MSTGQQSQQFQCIGCKSNLQVKIKSKKYKSKCPKCKTIFSISKAGTICFSSSSLEQPKVQNSIQKNKKVETKKITKKKKDSLRKTARIILDDSDEKKNPLRKTARIILDDADAIDLETLTYPKTRKTSSSSKKSSRSKTRQVQLEKQEERPQKKSSRSKKIKTIKEKKSASVKKSQKVNINTSFKSEKYVDEKKKTSKTSKRHKKTWQSVGQSALIEVQKKEKKLSRTTQRLQVLEVDIQEGFEGLDKIKARRGIYMALMIVLLLIPSSICVFFLLSAIPNQGFTTQGKMKKILTSKGDVLRKIFLNSSK